MYRLKGDIIKKRIKETGKTAEGVSFAMTNGKSPNWLHNRICNSRKTLVDEVDILLLAHILELRPDEIADEIEEVSDKPQKDVSAQYMSDEYFERLKCTIRDAVAEALK